MRTISRSLVMVLLGFGLGLGAINILSPAPIHAEQASTQPVRVHVQYHGITFINHARGMGVAESESYWKVEVARRFPNAVVIMGHGGDLPDGQWGMLLQDHIVKIKGTPLYMPQRVHVATEVKRVQAMYPGRIVVLICCNESGHLLHMPGVYHAMDSVWFVPDKQSDNTTEGRRSDPTAVGNVYEFNDD